jgi:hypothetical protein
LSSSLSTALDLVRTNKNKSLTKLVPLLRQVRYKSRREAIERGD